MTLLTRWALIQRRVTMPRLKMYLEKRGRSEIVVTLEQFGGPENLQVTNTHRGIAADALTGSLADLKDMIVVLTEFVAEEEEAKAAATDNPAQISNLARDAFVTSGEFCPICYGGKDFGNGIVRHRSGCSVEREEAGQELA